MPWASAHDQFVTAIGGGQVPDVAEMGSTWTPEFGDIGALEPAELGSGADGGARPVRRQPRRGGHRRRHRLRRALVRRGPGADLPDRRPRLARPLRRRPPGTSCSRSAGRSGTAPAWPPSAWPATPTTTCCPMVWQNGGEIAYREGRRVALGDGLARGGRRRAVLRRPLPQGALRPRRRAVVERPRRPQGVRGRRPGHDDRRRLGPPAPCWPPTPSWPARSAPPSCPPDPAGGRDSFAGGSHLVVFAGTKKAALARRYLDFLLDPAGWPPSPTKIGFLPGARDALDCRHLPRPALPAVLRPAGGSLPHLPADEGMGRLRGRRPVHQRRPAGDGRGEDGRRRR